MVLVLLFSRALFVSHNGSSSCSFKDRANIMGNTTQRLGTAFLDANSTGDLEYLKSTVGEYQSYINKTYKKGNLQCDS